MGHGLIYMVLPLGRLYPSRPGPPMPAPMGPPPPKTRFYLVCGGEQIPERERQDREQMNMICKVITSKGLAKKEEIYFVSGRGTQINSLVNGHYKINSDFGMYGPAAINPSQDDNGSYVMNNSQLFHPCTSFP